MEIKESDIFQSIPLRGKNGMFHSAVLTTFSIDLLNFDRRILQILHRKQICSVNVLVDRNQLNCAIEYVNPQFIVNAGCEYSLSPITAKADFHPKINFFVGDETVMVTVGSGNLTVSGQGKNHEIFTRLFVNKENEVCRPVVEECWQYLVGYVERYCSDYDKKRILNEIPKHCKYLDNSISVEAHSLYNIHEDLSVALLYNDNQSGILKQISALVPLEQIKTITIVSPFFDERGTTVACLANLCVNANVNVLLQKDCLLPPNRISTHDRIRFYDFDLTKRGQRGIKNFGRQLHAKILHLSTDDTEYCIIGSANATVAGIGTPSLRGCNDEFCVMYVSKKIDYLSELELKPLITLDIPINNLVRQKSISSDNDSVRNSYYLDSASFSNNRITVVCQHKIFDNIRLVVIGGYEDETINLLHVDNANEHIYSAEINISPVAICYLVDELGNCVSNKVFVNQIEALDNTNPSSTNRSISRIISALENNGYHGLEFSTMLSEIMAELCNGNEIIQRHRISSKSDETPSEKERFPDFEYNIEFSGIRLDTDRSGADSTTRLVNAVEESIKRAMIVIANELADEEEEGNSEAEYSGSARTDDTIVITNTTQKNIIKQVESLLKKYQKLVDTRRKYLAHVNKKEIDNNDLNFFSLTIFAFTEICYLNWNRYRFDCCSELDRSCKQKEFYEDLDNLNGLVLLAIEKFCTFCISNDWKKVSDFCVARTVKYIVLYVTLFDKKALDCRRVFSSRIKKCVKTIIEKFGIKDKEWLIEDLTMLSQRYDYIFRMKDIATTLNTLRNNK